MFCLITGLVAANGQDTSSYYSVRDFGAKGDGTADDTDAFQKALDTAGRNGGGVVHAGRGNYFFKGHLQVPKAVTFEGIWQSVPSHIGLRNPGLPKPTDDGTTFLVTENSGREEGAPFITLNDNSTLKGVVVFYPNQKADADPDPYPWTIAMRGRNPAVIDVELLNPFNAIDASNNERHLIRNVQGQPLRRGIYIDSIYDIGRLENVHFNPWWTMNKAYQWQHEHGEAFIFGRTDWQYVLNTFCFGYKVGYRFMQTPTGVCNGNFVGIGADDCFTGVEVEQCAPMGVLISNGEFASFRGPDPTMVKVGTNNAGSIRFGNSAFWGPCNQIAKVAGKGTVGFSDCTFVQWDRKNKGLAAIQVESGNIIVRGCEFQQDKEQVRVQKGVKAVISDNLVKGEMKVVEQGATVLARQPK